MTEMCPSILDAIGDSSRRRHADTDAARYAGGRCLERQGARKILQAFFKTKRYLMSKPRRVQPYHIILSRASQPTAKSAVPHVDVECFCHAIRCLTMDAEQAVARTPAVDTTLPES